MSTWDLVFRGVGGLLAIGFAYIERRKMLATADQRKTLRSQLLLDLAKTAWKSVEVLKDGGGAMSAADAEATYLNQIASSLTAGGGSALAPEEVAGLSAYAKMQSIAGKYDLKLKNGHSNEVK